MIVLFNIFSHEDMSEINEEQLLLYAQMANLVNLILQWPEVNIKEIAENLSKVLSFYNNLFSHGITHNMLHVLLSVIIFVSSLM